MSSVAAANEHLLLHFARNGSHRPGGNPLLVLERGEGCTGEFIRSDSFLRAAPR